MIFRISNNVVYKLKHPYLDLKDSISEKYGKFGIENYTIEFEISCRNKLSFWRLINIDRTMVKLQSIYYYYMIMKHTYALRPVAFNLQFPGKENLILLYSHDDDVLFIFFFVMCMKRYWGHIIYYHHLFISSSCFNVF